MSGLALQSKSPLQSVQQSTTQLSPVSEKPQTSLSIPATFLTKDKLMLTGAATTTVIATAITFASTKSPGFAAAAALLGGASQGVGLLALNQGGKTTEEVTKTQLTTDEKILIGSAKGAKIGGVVAFQATVAGFGLMNLGVNDAMIKGGAKFVAAAASALAGGVVGGTVAASVSKDSTSGAITGALSGAAVTAGVTYSFTKSPALSAIAGTISGLTGAYAGYATMKEIEEKSL